VSRKPRPRRRRKTKSRKVKAASGARKKVTKRVARRTSRAQRKVSRVKKAPKRSRNSLKSDPRLEAAVLKVNRGQSLSAAACESNITRKQLQSYLTGNRLTRRKGQRWVTKDNRPRRVPVMTNGRLRVLTVRGYDQARLVGEHHHAAGEFVRANDIKLIKPFIGQSVQAPSGRKYALEVDPNALHRIAAMDSPPFHEIYQITSNT
jgi:hypothetical protein